MRFDSLSEPELDEFLNIDYGITVNSNLSKVDRATQLWNKLQSYPDIIYPYPVVDLYIAENYRFTDNVRYTVNQVMDNLDLFINLFSLETDDPSLNQQRVLRILRFLDLLIDQEKSLISQPVRETLCSQLSLEDIDNFRLALNLNVIECRIPINDQDNQVNEIFKLQRGDRPYLLDIETNGSIQSLSDYIRTSNEKGIKTLIRLGLSPDVQKDGVPSLHYAIEKDDDMVELLLDLGADPNIQSESGELPLSLAMSLDRFYAVELLLERGADPNLKNLYGVTPLAEAIESGSLLVRTLLEAGADLNNTIVETLNPLIYGFEVDDVELIDTLIDWGIDPNTQDEDGKTGLIIASYRHSEEILDILLDRTDVNIQDKDGYTALIAASEGGFEYGVEQLLDKGADPNIQNNFGSTALIRAVIPDQIDIVRILLDNGADPNIQDSQGNTALMIAVKHDYPDMVKLLVNRGADRNIKNNDNQTALLMAIEYENIENIKILLKE